MAIDIDEVKVHRNEFGLWLGWTLATTAGMLLGFVPAALLVNELDLGLARVLIPLVAGLSVGLLQWLVLRGYFTHSADWILNGGAGWAASFALGLIVIQALAGSPLGAIVGYLLFGIIIGLVQWPVLRREIPNVLSWVLASVLGWALGALLSQVVLALFSGGEPIHPLATTAIVSIVTGLVAGAITGFVFVQIVRQRDRVVDRMA